MAYPQPGWAVTILEALTGLSLPYRRTGQNVGGERLYGSFITEITTTQATT